MTPERVRQVLVDGITDLNRRWIGPNAVQKAVLEACKTAIQLHPDLCKIIAPYVNDAYHRNLDVLTSSPDQQTFRYFGPLTLETKITLREGETSVIPILQQYRTQYGYGQDMVYLCIESTLDAYLKLDDEILAKSDSFTNGQFVLSHADNVVLRTITTDRKECPEIIRKRLFTMHPNMWCNSVRQSVDKDGTVRTDVITLTIESQHLDNLDNWK